MRQNTSRSEHGFSLLEMMMVLGILSLVLAVTMTAINDVQKRARVEEAKVDLTQESREFVEQMVRDLHQSGYPTSSMFATAPAVGATSYAEGLKTATTTSLTFEGDVDGDGVVDSVQYSLITDPDPNKNVPAGQCPCILQRSQLQKGVAGTNFTQEVDGVINSTGGAGSWTIFGNSANMSGVGTVANDTRYTDFKTDPIFRYYDQFGCELAPAGGAFNVVVAGTCTASAKTLADVRAVRITVSTLSTVVDPVSRIFPASSMTASARIANK